MPHATQTECRNIIGSVNPGVCCGVVIFGLGLGGNPNRQRETTTEGCRLREITRKFNLLFSIQEMEKTVVITIWVKCLGNGHPKP